MGGARQYAVLGPLSASVEHRAFVGCEVVDGAPRPDLPVAIVWLPDDVTKDPRQLARVQRETAFVAPLKHENILRLFGLECFEEGWARIIAFPEGENLAKMVSRARELGRRIEPSFAARILSDACDAIDFAHEEGRSKYVDRPIVHGGVRTDALVVRYDGVTQVAGFGSTVLGPAQHGEAAQQKAIYLAPEQIIGGKATATTASDIYGLGTVLFELLAGVPPFANEGDVERAILTQDAPRIEAPGVVGRLGLVAQTAMSKRGPDRYETAALMKAAIAAALEEPMATRAQLAEFVEALSPSTSIDRVALRELIDSARDPDSVTILSRPTETPVGVDSTLFAASRPGSTIQASADPLVERREDATIVEAAQNVQIPDDGPTIAQPFRDPREDSSPTERHTKEERPQTWEGLVEEARQIARDTGRTAADAPRSPDAGPRTGENVPSAEVGDTGLIDAPRGASAITESAPQIVASPPPISQPSLVPQAPPTLARPPAPPPPAAAPAEESALTPERDSTNVQAVPRGDAEPPRDPSPPQRRLEAPPAPARRTTGDLGAVPRAPMRSESAITNFDRKVGDSSRSTLLMIVGGVVVLIVGVFFFAKPPAELQQEDEQARHALPKEVVRAALEKAGTDQPPSPGTETAPPTEPPPAVNPAVAAEQVGRLNLTTEPLVDVFVGAEHLGRTPLNAKLPAGSQRLRFTDKDTGINIYKTYKVSPGAEQRDHITFGTSELVVNAPDGASVVLNSRLLGKAPLAPIKIYEGSYHLKVTLDGKSWANIFDASAGQKINYQVTLTDN